MTPDEHTISLLHRIEHHAGKELRNKEVMGTLIGHAHRTGRLSLLHDLGFHAKFASRTFGIMQRIGRDAGGYDKLASEFAESLDRLKALMRRLLAGTDEERNILARYFTQSQAGLEDLLSLLYDLSLYKNYLIDGQTDQRRA